MFANAEPGGQDSAGSFPYRHFVYGLVVESDFRLASIEAMPYADVEPSVRICFASPDTFLDRSRELPADPDDWLQYSVLPDGAVYLKLDGVLQTIVSADGRSVLCGRLGNSDPRSFEAHLLNFALSIALTLRG